MQSNFLDSCNEIIYNLNNRNYKTALTIILTLIDRSAKDTYKIKEIRERFRKLIDDNKDFIFWFGSGCLLMVQQNITIKRKSFSEILYSIRNSLIHDAELVDVDFVEGNTIFSGNGNRMVFNILTIYALFIVICYLQCNSFRFPKNIEININGKKFNLNKICGKGKNITIQEIKMLNSQ